MTHGGKREGAGRKPGSKSKATIEQRATLSELAREHTSTALDRLVKICVEGSDSAAVAAANALLDRAYGKPTQSVEHMGEGGGPVQHDHEIRVVLVKPSQDGSQDP